MWCSCHVQSASWRLRRLCGRNRRQKTAPSQQYTSRLPSAGHVATSHKYCPVYRTAAAMLCMHTARAQMQPQPAALLSPRLSHSRIREGRNSICLHNAAVCNARSKPALRDLPAQQPAMLSAATAAAKTLHHTFSMHLIRYTDS